MIKSFIIDNTRITGYGYDGEYSSDQLITYNLKCNIYQCPVIIDILLGHCYYCTINITRYYMLEQFKVNVFSCEMTMFTFCIDFNLEYMCYISLNMP